MFLVGIFSWWYGDGWRKRLYMIRERVISTNDYFSITILLSTLFSPFRQISASGVDGPVAVQLRAFFDNVISRVIGAIVRLFMIISGLVVLLFQTVLGIVVLIAWAFVPFMPIIGLLMFVIGWAPSWL